MCTFFISLNVIIFIITIIIYRQPSYKIIWGRIICNHNEQNYYSPLVIEDISQLGKIIQTTFSSNKCKIVIHVLLMQDEDLFFLPTILIDLIKLSMK